MVIKVDQFYSGTRQYGSSASPVVQSHPGGSSPVVLASTLLKLLKNVGLIYVLVVTSLQRDELVSLI